MYRFIPKKCLNCRESHNGINGHYYERFNVYMAYRTVPLCDDEKTEEDED